MKDGITNKRWAQNTSKKWTTVRHHLKEFNENLKYEDITDKTLSAYVLYCARDLGMLDSSIQKELSLLRWFLRWAEQKGYHNNNAYEKFRSAGELKRQKEARRRLSRAAAKREREQMLERQASLEEEIKRMFPIPQKIKIASQEE